MKRGSSKVLILFSEFKEIMRERDVFIAWSPDDVSHFTMTGRNLPNGSRGCIFTQLVIERPSVENKIYEALKYDGCWYVFRLDKLIERARQIDHDGIITSKSWKEKGEYSTKISPPLASLIYPFRLDLNELFQ